MKRLAVVLLLGVVAVVKGVNVTVSDNGCDYFHTFQDNDDDYHVSIQNVQSSCDVQTWTFKMQGNSFYWTIDNCYMDRNSNMYLKISSNETGDSKLTEYIFTGSPCNSDHDYDRDDWIEVSDIMVIKLNNPNHWGQHSQANFDITLYTSDFWHRFLGVVIGCSVAFVVILIGLCVIGFLCFTGVIACCCCAVS